MTALLHANREPFRAWAKHMASFGAQAALVAGSPFYQLLIGRMLGYREEHIHHHIRVSPPPPLCLRAGRLSSGQRSVGKSQLRLRHGRHVMPGPLAPGSGRRACAVLFATWLARN